MHGERPYCHIWPLSTFIHKINGVFFNKHMTRLKHKRLTIVKYGGHFNEHDGKEQTLILCFELIHCCVLKNILGLIMAIWEPSSRHYQAMIFGMFLTLMMPGSTAFHEAEGWTLCMFNCRLCFFNQNMFPLQKTTKTIQHIHSSLKLHVHGDGGSVLTLKSRE